MKIVLIKTFLFFNIILLSLYCYKNDIKEDLSISTSIQTLPISQIRYNSAKTGGNIIINDKALISAKGICWNLSGNPTINDSVIFNNTDSTYFEDLLVNLTPNTTYMVRAFVTSGLETKYGNELSFTTTIPNNRYSNNRFSLIGNGFINETILSGNVKGDTLVSVTAIPATGWYFWYWGYYNRDTNSYNINTTDVFSFETNSNIVVAHFLDHPVTTLVPQTNLRRYFSISEDKNSFYKSAWDTALNLVNNNPFFLNIINHSANFIYPYNQPVYNNLYIRRAHATAEPAKQNDGTGGRIDMLEPQNENYSQEQVKVFADVLIHEAGHVVHSFAVIGRENNDRVYEYFQRYKQEAISAGINIIEHYQFNNELEYFACCTAAYFNALYGSGSIGNKNQLRQKYPLMFDLLVSIFN